MAISDNVHVPTTEQEQESKKIREERPEFVEYTFKKPSRQHNFWKNVTSPIGTVVTVLLLIIALLSAGLAAALVNGNGSNSTTSAMNNNSMSNSNTTTAPANIPMATQQYGNQPAKYVLDSDGAKHFTFTAKQVLWTPVKGDTPVQAWTLDGTVPGPMIRVTANDHLRITIINHLPHPTALHWHGLMLPSSVDGVPGIGQKPIQPGQTYTYDFTVHDQDVGTHWYHSHYDDLTQVPGGLYGAFIVDPRPGTPQYQQAIHANVDYTAIISELGPYYVISGKSFPDTLPIHVKHGQTVHIRLIGASEMSHPMHLHGSFFNIVAEDGHTLAQPIQKDTLLVSPGETYDITFYAWAAPGSVYPFHCHILSHLMNPGQTGDEMGGLIVLIEYDK